MVLTKPVPFAEGLQTREVRSLLPTDLRTADFGNIPEQLRARSVFSAYVTQAEILQQGSDSIRAIENGESDIATQRVALRDVAIAMGYQPPQGEAGGLADFRSGARLNLFLEMG